MEGFKLQLILSIILKEVSSEDSITLGGMSPLFPLRKYNSFCLEMCLKTLKYIHFILSALGSFRGILPPGSPPRLPLEPTGGLKTVPDSLPFTVPPCSEILRSTTG